MISNLNLIVAEIVVESREVFNLRLDGKIYHFCFLDDSFDLHGVNFNEHVEDMFVSLKKRKICVMVFERGRVALVAKSQESL